MWYYDEKLSRTQKNISCESTLVAVQFAFAIFIVMTFFSLFCCALSSDGSKAPRCSLSGRNYFFNGCKSLFFPVSLTLLGTETMDQEQVEIYFCVFILKSAEPFDMTFSAAAAAQTCEETRRGDFMMRKVLMCAALAPAT